MLPSGALGDQILKNIKAYAGTEHPHEAQKPEVLDIASMNEKNKRWEEVCGIEGTETERGTNDDNK